MTIKGDKVICIVAVRDEIRVDGANYPVLGNEYVVREARADQGFLGPVTLLLEGIDNSHFVGVTVAGRGTGHLEPGFPESGFRRVEA